MKVLKVIKRPEKFLQCDISTVTENFFVKSDDSWLLIHNSPAIICGINPENGKFFVGTKSVFNVGEPKINYTFRDIDRYYGDSPDLAKKLKVALRYLPELNITGVLQGDLMFTHEDLQEVELDGKKNIVFTPNTISYFVPVHSSLANQISSAQMGIVFHTTYVGHAMRDMEAKFGADTSSLLRSKNVWVSSAEFKDVSGSASFTKAESAYLNYEIETMQKLEAEAATAWPILNKDMGAQFRLYINHRVRQGSSLEDAESIYEEFFAFITGQRDKKIATLKTQRGKDRYTEETEKKIEYYKDHKTAIMALINLYVHVIKVKLFILKKLRAIGSIGTFIKTPDGYKVTSPEGFVAVDNIGGHAFKLVDRLEFSRHNFLARKVWQG